MKTAYLTFYVAVLAWITWRASRKETEADYLNSSKRLTAWESTWTTFASLLTGYNFVLGTTFAYLYGFWYLAAFVGAALAFVALYKIFKRTLAKLQEGHDLFSAGDYFGVVFGPATRVMVNVILSIGLLLFLVLQVFVNTQLFAMLLGMSREAAMLLTVGAVAVYLWFGGFKASVLTDVFQGLLILPIVLTIFVFPSHFTTENISSGFPMDQLGFAIGLAALQFLSLLGQAESFQRVFASKDAATLKKGLVTSFVLLAIVAGAIAYLGLNFRFAGVAVDPANLFTEGVLTVLPLWLSSLLTVSLIAAFMGTIDSSAFALGVILARGWGQRREGLVNRTRFYMLLSIAAAGALSLYSFSFLVAVFGLIALISLIGLAFLLSAYLSLSAAEINGFLAVGTITHILGMTLKFITENPLTALIPSAVALLALLLIRAEQRLFRQRSRERAAF